MAKAIMGTFNEFPSIDGYSISFPRGELAIKDTNGEVVYDGPGGIHSLLHPDGTAGDYGKLVFDAAMEVDAGFRRLNKGSHYFNIFHDSDFDWGFTGHINAPIDDSPMTPPYKDKFNCTYTGLLDSYQNRPYHVHVISGSFSAYFIRRIREDVGPTQVVVVNIKRNPSIVYAIGIKNESERLQSPAGDYSTDENARTVIKSVESTIILQDLNDVQTIAYEDILKKGSFDILYEDADQVVRSKTVPIPKQLNDNNGLFTRQEYDYISEKSNINLPWWNQWLTNYHCEKVVTDDAGNLVLLSKFEQVEKAADNPALLAILNLAPSDQFPTLLAKLPRDLFAYLGYTPLLITDVKEF